MKSLERNNLEVFASDSLIKNQKKAIRMRILHIRDEMTQKERQEASYRLTNRILNHSMYEESDCLIGFVSFGSEADTKAILQDALNRGKIVYVPRIELDNAAGKKEMFFYEIKNLGDLRPGFRGIPEPSGDSSKFIYGENDVKRTLMLMPGVAFDHNGNRLGYGGGFYDRFLTDKEALRIRTIAVGFSCQLLDELPVDSNDLKPF